MVHGPKILVFDSGLGGLTVLAEIRCLRPDGNYLYVADDAVFPYGGLQAPVVLARVEQVLAALIEVEAPDIVVIACNTASTLVLPRLRERWPHLPFIGTVPAIKPGAQASLTGMISVLATPGTVERDYTQNLIREFAGHCAVNLVGSVGLAALAEQHMNGICVDEALVAREIAPAFVQAGGKSTDVIVLACTHYPLLLPIFQHLAPWPVRWIDAAPAIARRADQVLNTTFAPAERVHGTNAHVALFTSGRRPPPLLEAMLQARGLMVREWSLAPSQ